MSLEDLAEELTRRSDLKCPLCGDQPKTPQAYANHYKACSKLHGQGKPAKEPKRKPQRKRARHDDSPRAVTHILPAVQNVVLQPPAPARNTVHAVLGIVAGQVSVFLQFDRPEEVPPFVVTIATSTTKPVQADTRTIRPGYYAIQGVHDTASTETAFWVNVDMYNSAPSGAVSKESYKVAFSNLVACGEDGLESRLGEDRMLTVHNGDGGAASSPFVGDDATTEGEPLSSPSTSSDGDGDGDGYNDTDDDDDSDEDSNDDDGAPCPAADLGCSFRSCDKEEIWEHTGRCCLHLRRRLAQWYKHTIKLTHHLASLTKDRQQTREEGKQVVVKEGGVDYLDHLFRTIQRDCSALAAQTQQQPQQCQQPSTQVTQPLGKTRVLRSRALHQSCDASFIAQDSVMDTAHLCEDWDVLLAEDYDQWFSGERYSTPAPCSVPPDYTPAFDPTSLAFGPVGYLCSQCGLRCRSAAGLGSHIKFRHSALWTPKKRPQSPTLNTSNSRVIKGEQ